ncbi:MAG: hypothetical protein GY768_28260 [Planctomycetaceae bacterium]|nr:hypothetical protein [Planctomycetaceae bacterium]
MRLTLRTLLAYLDDILDESDARELQQKIDESEMATQLVHRIRQIVGQTRLDSPALDAAGSDGDANAVSEYLDNTLAADTVPEFERYCLDSDVQLGEVAACHQILTLVLGEPAEITPQLREQIYKLNEKPSDEQIEPVAATRPAEMEAGTNTEEAIDDLNIEPIAEIQASEPATYDSDEHWTSAPDYLRKPESGMWKPVGIAAMIAFCLAFAGLRGMGPLNQSHPLAQWFQGEQVAELPNNLEDIDVPEVTIPEQPGEKDLADDESGNRAIDQASSPNTASVVPPPVPAPSAIAAPSQTDVTPDNSSATEAQEVDAASVDPSDPSNAVGFEAPFGASTDSPQIEATATSPPNIPELPTDTLPNRENAGIIDLGPDNSVPSVNDLAVSIPATGIADETADGDINPGQEEAREVGKFLSEDQLLARFNPLSNLWDRIPARDSIREREDLLSFPIFRPQIMLPTGIQLTLVGPAKIQLLQQGSDDSPGIGIDFGRATIETFSQVGSKIDFEWMSQSAVANLADIKSSFAIEVSRQFMPGSDIIKDEAHIITSIYTTSGSVAWQINDSEPITVAAGQRLTIVDDKQARVDDVSSYPAWIDGSDSSPRDPAAIRSLLPEVGIERPVGLSLKEQADSRRLEVRSLAVCSLAFLGDFDSLLLAMNDNRMKAYWTDEYTALTQAMTMNPESAQKLLQALEDKHGPEGRDLFRLLAGFNSVQLQAGNDQKLISYLDHPSSDFRIVAHENLKAITGIPSLYMPHYADKLRKPHVFKWKDKLNKGQIVYRDPPSLSLLLDGETTDE